MNPAQNDPESTTFGFESIDASRKTQRVQGVFDSVASRYDLMNDLMSLGLHRLWKRHLVALARPKPGQVLLDCAAGTGDVSALLYPYLQGLLLMNV